MVHKIWIFKEKHVLILYYFVLIKAGKGLTTTINIGSCTDYCAVCHQLLSDDETNCSCQNRSSSSVKQFISIPVHAQLLYVRTL